jgi:hypothetical protein
LAADDEAACQNNAQPQPMGSSRKSLTGEAVGKD